MSDNDLDVVGYWTEIKLEIVREYASAYCKILKNQPHIKHVAYIDGFAGAGTHIAKSTGQEIDGSPAIALKLNFDHYHFIDLDKNRIQQLKELSCGSDNVTVYEKDCNEVLLNTIFPFFEYRYFSRALCLLDPYKLDPDWAVVKKAGETKSIEIFLNFMIMDANMNALKNDPNKVTPAQTARMTKFWGDESWKEAAYTKEQGLFGPIQEKAREESIVSAYKERLKKVAGFQYVPDPIPMKNSKRQTVYYLFFASPNKTGNKIVQDIFNKYRNRGF